MTHVYADIEALKALRQALLTFAARQSDALQEAEAEIACTQAALHEAEQRWRYEVERRRAEVEACYVQAMIATQQGYAVDCSGYVQALRYAEEHLTRILEWQRQVEIAVSQYRSVAQSFASLLQDLLPRATSYLADRITALEAYYAMRVMQTATALAHTGVSGVMGGVIAAVRRSKGELNRVMGSSGDLHLRPTQAGEQGSPGWIAAEAARMADRDSAQWSPANERIAALVQKLGAENVPALTVVINLTNNQADIYTRAPTGWQPLHSGIGLEEALQRPGLGPQTPPEFREGIPGVPERKG